MMSHKCTGFCSYFLAVDMWTRGHWTETGKGSTATIDVAPSFHRPFPRPPNGGLHWLCLRADKTVANAATSDRVYTRALTSQPDTCVRSHADRHNGSRVTSVKLSWSKMQTGPKLNCIPLTFASPHLNLSSLIHQPCSSHATAAHSTSSRSKFNQLDRKYS